ncbi:MAG: hypothetical protein UT63_C0002G0012 [Candidatus Gottesmanbacteria bacterium GW2011_GWC2_39_8]|uniref:PIN domain-containing protein n=1 Tax=Candidatus Gottesmanbacteria bacterium GW2011_GWC2_39_8 TaxID=1618450 RepID=A0A0G0T927_9BACT|nr:MAG: hypothetical protein UT63_C0002G0012 [Candidatus Gottesmanbacteria bacterium GW2011_GWC2_39_8]
MISAVLDTNILASGAITSFTPPGQILDAWRDAKFNLIVSEHILDEITRTLQKPYFRKHITDDKLVSFIELLQNEAITTLIIFPVHGVATHPEDDLTLATAVNADADYLVTGDDKLLKKVGKNYRGIKLVTPNEFLQLLEENQ